MSWKLQAFHSRWRGTFLLLANSKINWNWKIVEEKERKFRRGWKHQKKLNLKSFCLLTGFVFTKLFALQCEKEFLAGKRLTKGARLRDVVFAASSAVSVELPTAAAILTGICGPALLCYPRNWTRRWLSGPWSASSIGWVLLVHMEEPRWQLCICRRNRLSRTRCKQTKRFKMQLNIYVHMESHFRIFLTQDAKINVWQFIAQSMLAFQGFELEFCCSWMVIYSFVSNYFNYEGLEIFFLLHFLERNKFQ